MITLSEKQVIEVFAIWDDQVSAKQAKYFFNLAEQLFPDQVTMEPQPERQIHYIDLKDEILDQRLLDKLQEKFSKTNVS